MCDKDLVRISRRHAMELLAAAVVLRARRALAEDGVEPYRWIAGLGRPPFESAEWDAFAKLEDGRWKADEARIRAMRTWAERETAPLVARGQTLFYPFAGPDALHALALFGGARRMLLVGLEPIGALPDTKRGAGVAPGYFTRLGEALADMHRLGFFRTREMSSDFQRDGVLGALVAAVVRMGGRIGAVRTSSPREPKKAQIDWTNAAGEPRRLDYVQADLANAGLKASPAVVAEIESARPAVTFLKAAMYLPFEPRFSELRRLVLEGSSVVVEDDTGLPFRSFDERWAVRLFGRYETPVSPFEDRLQPSLKAAFERGAPPALPFGIGYHVLPQRSHLLVASKGAG